MRWVVRFNRHGPEGKGAGFGSAALQHARGWHGFAALIVPANIALLPLPSNRLVDQPWRIMSIGLRDWAHG